MSSCETDSFSVRKRENDDAWNPSAPSSFLRWAGSKRKLLPQIRSFCPLRYRTYVEPFAGSACLFFMLQPKRAILGDFNAELMATYNANRDRVLT
jgi:DNA adenine methylase